MTYMYVWAYSTGTLWRGENDPSVLWKLHISKRGSAIQLLYNLASFRLPPLARNLWWSSFRVFKVRGRYDGCWDGDRCSSLYVAWHQRQQCLVWGKLQSYNWWPGVVISHSSKGTRPLMAEPKDKPNQVPEVSSLTCEVEGGGGGGGGQGSPEGTTIILYLWTWRVDSKTSIPSCKSMSTWDTLKLFLYQTWKSHPSSPSTYQCMLSTKRQVPLRKSGPKMADQNIKQDTFK